MIAAMLRWRLHDALDHTALLLLLASVFWTCTVADPDAITTKGSDFVFANNGSRFIMRGISYGSHPPGASADYLSDGLACENDIALLRDLNVNTILVDYIDPREDHASCMSNFANNNIYVVAQLYGPAGQLDYVDGGWQRDLYAAATGTIDSLASYSNMLGFAVGAFPLFDIKTTNLPFYKAAVRDMKQYIIDRSYRTVLVGALIYGYPNTFDPTGQEIVDNTDDYLQCDDLGADFVGPFITSTALYDACKPQEHIDSLIARYTDAKLPTFIADIACDQRDYKELDTIYSPTGLASFAGAIVANYFDVNATDLGLVNRTDHFHTPDTLPAYAIVSSKLSSIATITATAQPEPTNPACPTQNVEISWNANTTLPPTPNAKLCSCMMDTLPCITTKDKESTLATSYAFPYELMQPCEQSLDNCAGVWANGTTGQYGAFSMCTRSERYSWAASAYLARNGEAAWNASSLHFATEIRTLPKGDEEGCKALLGQVGSDGRGTVTASVGGPTGTTTASGVPKGGHDGGGGVASGDGVARSVKIGIAVGVVAGVALILLVGALLWVRRRRKRRAAQSSEGVDLAEKPEKPEKDSDDTWIDPKEADGDTIFEAPRTIPEKPVKEDSPAELPAYEKACEMDADVKGTEKDRIGHVDEQVIHPSLR